MGEMTHFHRPDGQKAPAYFAEPSPTSKAPGIVVIQEWWGINAQMKGIADRLADEDFRVLVPDLYRGRLAADADEANHLMGDLDWQDAVFQDVQGAVNYLLTTHSDQVAVLGFCMGGALTIAAGVRTTGMDCGVCFYGIPPRELADPSQLKVPMLFHFAENDDWCNATAVEQLKHDLENVRAETIVEIYPGTQHAFMNEARPEVYDHDAARIAWDRSIAFLRENLLT